MKKIVALILLFLSIVLYHYYTTNTNKIIDSIYLNKSIELKSTIESLIDKKQGDASALTYLISQDKNLQQALIKKDNSLVDFTQTIKGLSKNTRFKNIWIQVLDKDGRSFYRSWTKKVGDNVSKARVDVADMIKNPKPMNQISTGKFDMTFRSIKPLYYEGKFVGMVEMITHFNSIAKTLQRNDIEPVMIVDESYTRKFIKPLTGIFISNHYVANKNASKTLMKHIENNDIYKFINIDTYLLFQDYIVTSYETRNLKNKPMGFHVLFYKINKIDMHEIQEFKISFLIKMIVFSIFIILVIIVLANQTYLNKLNIKVKEKTKELSIILGSYDANVISSQTDTNGIITYASAALCEISGYSKEELIGQNHNIMRHKDMSALIFKELWKTIKSGKEWEGEIKNLKKNKGYYWTKSKVTPMLNEDNEIIGFSSIRHDITAQKDFDMQHKQLIESEKMASIGEMIGNIAHQWRQPLSVISTSATALSLKEECGILGDDDISEACENINKNAQYLSKTIDDFRNFIKGDQEIIKFNIDDVLNSFLHLVASTIKKDNIKMVTSFSKDINIEGYPNELIQCFINIFNNSKDALVENNELSNRYIFIDVSKINKQVIITFKDNAGGINSDILPKIFEPYFTTKHQSRGTGLGLHMTYNFIVDSMKGSIKASNSSYIYENNAYKGAQFTIRLELS